MGRIFKVQDLSYISQKELLWEACLGLHANV